MSASTIACITSLFRCLQLALTSLSGRDLRPHPMNILRVVEVCARKYEGAQTDLSGWKESLLLDPMIWKHKNPTYNLII